MICEKLALIVATILARKFSDTRGFSRDVYNDANADVEFYLRLPMILLAGIGMYALNALRKKFFKKREQEHNVDAAILVSSNNIVKAKTRRRPRKVIKIHVPYKLRTPKEDSNVVREACNGATTVCNEATTARNGATTACNEATTLGFGDAIADTDRISDKTQLEPEFVFRGNQELLLDKQKFKSLVKQETNHLKETCCDKMTTTRDLFNSSVANMAYDEIRDRESTPSSNGGSTFLERTFDVQDRSTAIFEAVSSYSNGCSKVFKETIHVRASSSAIFEAISSFSNYVSAAFGDNNSSRSIFDGGSGNAAIGNLQNPSGKKLQKARKKIRKYSCLYGRKRRNRNRKVATKDE